MQVTPPHIYQHSSLTPIQFTAPDLSTIAHGIDALEETYAGANPSRGSDNMDDTGTPHFLVTNLMNDGLSQRLLLCSSARESAGRVGSYVSFPSHTTRLLTKR
jgi:hypothetical protein